MRVAVIGSGVSGLVAASLLQRKHDVTVFEAGAHVGGHVNTLDVELEGRDYSIDTGFIVHNERNYPGFIRLIEHLGVPTRPTSMSFSVRCDRTGLEYNGTNLNSLFAQRRNLVRPRFWGMLLDILRFNRSATSDLDHLGPETTVAEYLNWRGYSRAFAEQYLLPMGAAIWSCPVGTFADFPIRFIIEFFDNHGLLTVRNQPTWKVIEGGSRAYVDALTSRFRSPVRTSTPVESVRRGEDFVTVTSRNRIETFDEVIFACHSDQALTLLEDPSANETELLSAFPYSRSLAVLHTDATVLPRRQRAWAAWNYHIPSSPTDAVTVTYNMNILQHLDAPETFCVTLNEENAIDPARILARIPYSHPIFTTQRDAAQARHHEVIRTRRTSFCGAYWGNGFHEAGLASAVRVCDAFGISLDEIVADRAVVYLDLSELNTVFGRSWLWSTRRPALARFRREDHLGRSHEPLETSVRSLVERETGNRPTGPIRLLTHLRYFGYVMNPVSFYFCFDEAGHNVEAIVAEVNNTPWGEQHCYVLGPHNACESDDSTMRFEHDKEFHVSPFMSMKMRYRWRVTSPGERLAVRIACWRGEELLFTAELDLKRQPITPKRLRTVLLAYPLMTAKVFAAIYFEALRNRTMSIVLEDTLKPEAGEASTGPHRRWIERLGERLLYRLLASLKEGQVTVDNGRELKMFGPESSDLTATVTVHSSKLYGRLLHEGALGAAESYLQGEWTADDLTKFLRIVVRGIDSTQQLSGPVSLLSRMWHRLRHALNHNSFRGSQRNIAAHYDLSNDFFRLFLDETLAYSSGLFYRDSDTLYDASVQKFDRICRLLDLQPSDHLLEIGTGWGGFALHAATRYGCKVTTTTISRQQYRVARQRIKEAGLGHRVTLLLEDYRNLTGQYDKLASIEMIEAVGHQYMDAYFRRCSTLLKPDGLMALQGIVIRDQHYEQYLKSVDFIQKYIFPGGCLPSVSAMSTSCTRASDFRMLQLADFAPHYAQTLRLWRERFFAEIERVRALGFDDRFIRMWEYYLCYCEAAFTERSCGLVQMLLARPQARHDVNRDSSLLPPETSANDFSAADRQTRDRTGSR
ncbi:Tuberculostearic acid methyltransferase UfaA1 (TSA methyltransferase), partial [Durusdinium trenchii]